MSYLFLQIDPATMRRRLTASSAGTWYQEVPTGTVDGSNALFTFAQVPNLAGSTFIYLDGLLVPNTDYTLNLVGGTVTFTVPPVLGQRVYVTYIV